MKNQKWKTRNGKGKTRSGKMEVENGSGKLSGKTLFRYLGMRGKKINRR